MIASVERREIIMKTSVSDAALSHLCLISPVCAVRGIPYPMGISAPYRLTHEIRSNKTWNGLRETEL